MQQSEKELLQEIVALLREIVQAQGGTGKCSSYWVDTKIKKLDELNKKLKQ